MQRILKGSAKTIQNTFLVGETPTDSTTAVTIEVLRENGVVLIAAGTAASAGVLGDGTYSYTLLPAHTSQVDILTVRWTATISGQLMTLETRVEVVGAYYFTLAAARASDSALASTSEYTTAALEEARNVVEDEAETICGVAFVERYRRVRLNGTAARDLLLPDQQVREVFSVTVDDTAYTVAELGDLIVDGGIGRILRPEGSTFTYGALNVEVAYSHGYDEPPSDVRRAALIRLRHILFATRSGIPDRATSFSASEGGTFGLSTPGQPGTPTGIPEVDAVYGRHQHHVPAVA